jgi:hypothetical protein
MKRVPILALSLVLVCFSARTGAQTPADPQDPANTAERRLGPLRFTPELRLDIGVDTNVFHVSTDRSRDLSVEFSPHISSWLRLGRARLSGITTVEFLYFREFASERSVNGSQQLTLELPLNRIRPYVSVTAVTTRERLNFEIDARARHIEQTMAAGVDLRVTPKTTFTVHAEQERLKFATNSQFLDVELREVLNRTWGSLTGALRRAVTPYTTLVMQAEAQRERFEFSPERDSDSTRFMPGVEFNKNALIHGKAFVGYRRFVPRSAVIPRFSGVVASADLGYTMRGVTRFGVLTERDVAYSVDPAHPYYRLQSWTGLINHQATERWLLGATVGHHRLAFRPVLRAVPSPDVGALPPPDPPGALATQAKNETVLRVGGNIGLRLGPDTVLTFGVDQFKRSSQVTQREYQGLRVSTNITMRD